MPDTDTLLTAIAELRRELNEQIRALRTEWQNQLTRLISVDTYQADKRGYDERLTALEGRPDRARASVAMWVGIGGLIVMVLSCAASAFWALVASSISVLLHFFH